MTSLNAVPALRHITTHISTTTTSATSPNTSAANAIPSHPHPIPLAMIIGLASGSLVILVTFAMIFVFKRCTRTPPIPAPSRHTLAPPCKDEYLPPESPLFGGKERFSHHSVSNLTWTDPFHHRHRPKSSVGSKHYMPYATRSQTALHPDDGSDLSFSSHFHTLPVSCPMPSAVSRKPTAFSRTPSTSSGHRLIPARYAASDTWDQDLEYGGPDVVLPIIPVEESEKYVVPLTTSNSRCGRTRIRSGYFDAGPYPHLSIHSQTPIPTWSTQTHLDSLSTVKSDAQRIRDTRALASTLLLAPPPPPRCPAMLYSDDSFSISRNEDDICLQSNAHTFADPITLSDSDTGFALGNLMLSDLGATTKC